MKKSIFIFLFFIQFITYGQGSGPRTFPLPPKDITAINFFYVNLVSNLTPSKDVILDRGTVNIDAFALPIVHSFSLAGNLAQVFVSPGVGHISGIIETDDHQSEIVDISGLLDANVMMRIGLINSPALNIENYSKRELKFQLSGLLGVTVPIGQYDQERIANLGGNRWGIKVGMPMIIPLSKNKDKMFLWEIVPSVTFYTKNKEPRVGDTKTQKPLFWIEQHLTRNFTKRFWASIDVGYQYGGKTYIDDISDGSVINQLAAGGSLAYAPFSNIPLTFQGTYSQIWFNETSGYMIRFGANVSIPSKSDRKMLKAIKEKQ
jgi:hypothetical protein